MEKVRFSCIAYGPHTHIEQRFEPISGCVCARRELSPRLHAGSEKAAHFLRQLLLSVVGSGRVLSHTTSLLHDTAIATLLLAKGCFFLRSVQCYLRGA